jgi:hypothetical protein
VEVLSALAAGIFTLLGVWFGHQWAEKSAIAREERSERKQKGSIRDCPTSDFIDVDGERNVWRSVLGEAHHGTSD